MRSLKTDHEVLEEMFNQLLVQLEKPNLTWALDTLDLLGGCLVLHFRAENACLFPAILKAPRESFGKDLASFEITKATIEGFQKEHDWFLDQLGEAARELRAMIMRPKNDASQPKNFDLRIRIAAIALEFHQHNETEEDKLHQLPRLLLNEADRSRLDLGIRTEILSLPARFAWAS